MIDTLLPLVTSASSLPIAILAVFALAGAVVYSTRIAYTLYHGYRTATTSRAGYIAVGLLLITTVPIVLRFAMATVGSVPTAVIVVVAAVSEIAGLVAIIYGIYDPGGGR